MSGLIIIGHTLLPNTKLVQPLFPMLALQYGQNFTEGEVTTGLIRVSTGIIVAAVVNRFVVRNPWPRPFRIRFVAFHTLAAFAFSLLWQALASIFESLFSATPFLVLVTSRVDEVLFIGVVLYIIVAGISYAVESSARAARAEAISARTQLAALRAQLHPHFLFNALHTVVQLIPIDPARAAEAAEMVAGLLRTTLEEKRDTVTLADEWAFVSRYLAVEQIRFGDRIVLQNQIDPDLLTEHVPAFALQTLVENAVRHGAAPRVAPTQIIVSAVGTTRDLTVSVRNSSGAGATRAVESGTGTGLARLRERLAVLYGSAARLDCKPNGADGFEAILVLPRHRGGQP